MSFGSRLLKIRTERNMSQEELAERLDVSRLTIHRWENDKSAPNVNQVESLCQVFGVNVSCFFEETGPVLELVPASEAEEKPRSKTSTRKKELITVVISLLAMLVCIVLTVFVGMPQETVLDKVMFGDGSVQVQRIYRNIPALIICAVLLVVSVICFIISLSKLLKHRKNGE